MVDWLTLQETAEKVGIRKGTLLMWRNRNQFPFKTEGKGRNLKVDSTSVVEWLKTHKDDVVKGANRPRKPLAKPAVAVGKKAAGAPGKKRGPKPGKKLGRKPGKKPGVKAAVRPASRSTAIVVQGDMDLATLQKFVAEIKGGCSIQALPMAGGTRLTTVK